MRRRRRRSSPSNTTWTWAAGACVRCCVWGGEKVPNGEKKGFEGDDTRVRLREEARAASLGLVDERAKGGLWRRAGSKVNQVAWAAHWIDILSRSGCVCFERAQSINQSMLRFALSIFEKGGSGFRLRVRGGHSLERGGVGLAAAAAPTCFLPSLACSSRKI